MVSQRSNIAQKGSFEKARVESFFRPRINLAIAAIDITSNTELRLRLPKKKSFKVA